MKITSLALAAVLAALVAPARAAGPHAFIKIADTNTPGTVLGTFAGFPIDPAVDDGVAVFSSSAGPGFWGVYAGIGGPASLRINIGDVTPYGPLAWSPQAPDIDDGVISFWGGFAGGHAIFKTTLAADIVPIVRTGDLAPMGPFTDLYQSASISGGNVAAFGFHHYTGTTQTVSGIFVGDGTTLTLSLRLISPLLRGPACHLSGTFLLRISATRASSSAPISPSTWPMAAPSPKLLSRETPWPTAGYGGPVGGVAISGDTVAFAAGTFAGKTVFRGDGGPLVTIARAGQAAPGDIGG